MRAKCESVVLLGFLVLVCTFPEGASAQMSWSDEQIRSKFGKPVSVDRESELNTVTATLIYTIEGKPKISASYTILDGKVERIIYENHSVFRELNEAEIFYFLQRTNSVPGAQLIDKTEADGAIMLSFDRSGGQMGYVLMLPERIIAVQESAKWIERRKQYDEENAKKPWYKKLF